MALLTAGDCRKSATIAGKPAALVKFLLVTGTLLSPACAIAPRIDQDRPSRVEVVHRRMETVIAAWKKSRPLFRGNPFLEKPQLVSPYHPGKTAPGFLRDGLQMVNFVRFLAGVPDDIELEEKFNEEGQYGAVLLARKGFISHTPIKPYDMAPWFYARGLTSTISSNLHFAGGRVVSLADAVRQLCSDSDPLNIENVGHRRFIINPGLRRTGFGYAVVEDQAVPATFVTMKVLSEFNKSDGGPAMILWPAAGYFPGEFFAPHDAWSISLDPGLFRVDDNEVRVRLERVIKWRLWEFGPADRDRFGKYFNVSRGRMGYQLCLIFRPDGLERVEHNIFRVTVRGVRHRDGRPALISYNVIFYPLGESFNETL